MFKFNLTNKLIKYTDLDWARLKKGKKSTSKYIFIFLSKFVSYQSNKQATIFYFLIKIKYMAMIKAKKKTL